MVSLSNHAGLAAFALIVVYRPLRAIDYRLDYRPSTID